MAVLSDTVRGELHKEFMQDWSRRGESTGLLKSELRGLINTVDAYFNTNAGTINSALQTADSNWNSLTNAQKAYVIAYVLLERYARGS